MSEATAWVVVNTKQVVIKVSVVLGDHINFLAEFNLRLFHKVNLTLIPRTQHPMLMTDKGIQDTRQSTM
ncbi:hypothetical protein Bpfe_030437 [Biomphalaria pfeifferi]|uniref:Uncharacterized protein n=1 Tax=Biomphalaria pfeifferi TaxID=112525 RepID=A0AAD8AQL1_BIOPF|nr:hypothetical protein Bpfe_030437 [Biomphalaria pfeifferi]